MSLESKQELLKNVQVRKVQGSTDWAEPLEEAIKLSLTKVLAEWTKAATTEGIGPREAVKYLQEIGEYISLKKVVEEPLKEKSE